MFYEKSLQKWLLSLSISVRVIQLSYESYFCSFSELIPLLLKQKHYLRCHLNAHMCTLSLETEIKFGSKLNILSKHNVFSLFFLFFFQVLLFFFGPSVNKDKWDFFTIHSSRKSGLTEIKGQISVFLFWVHIRIIKMSRFWWIPTICCTEIPKLSWIIVSVTPNYQELWTAFFYFLWLLKPFNKVNDLISCHIKSSFLHNKMNNVYLFILMHCTCKE